MVAARTRAVRASPARTSAKGRSRRSGHPGARVSALMAPPLTVRWQVRALFFRGPARNRPWVRPASGVARPRVVPLWNGPGDLPRRQADSPGCLCLSATDLAPAHGRA